jgi:phosphoribosyl 1,2-cyclic phosphodiesterase
MSWIKFLGTAGARFAVTRQIRKSGGMWLVLDDVQLLIDPGPGSLVRCLSSKPKLNPVDLDGIILSHRHIDHCNDVNIMIEAMTNGGHKKKGVLFVPSDALTDDPVVLHHFRNHIDKISVLHEKGKYFLKSLSFETPVQHIHDVESYGIRFFGSDITVSYITDTQYFEGLESFYNADVLILNIVLMEPKSWINHLSVVDAEKIISAIQPKVSILTHFGMTMIRADPWKIAKQLSEKTQLTVVAANDGQTFSLNQNEISH